MSAVRVETGSVSRYGRGRIGAAWAPVSVAETPTASAHRMPPGDQVLDRSRRGSAAHLCSTTSSREEVSRWGVRVPLLPEDSSDTRLQRNDGPQPGGQHANTQQRGCHVGRRLVRRAFGARTLDQPWRAQLCVPRQQVVAGHPADPGSLARLGHRHLAPQRSQDDPPSRHHPVGLAAWHPATKPSARPMVTLECHPCARVGCGSSCAPCHARPLLPIQAVDTPTHPP